MYTTLGLDVRVDLLTSSAMLKLKDNSLMMVGNKLLRFVLIICSSNYLT